MFQGRITAVLFSILIHGLLIYLIANTVNTTPKKPLTKPKALQSFLYKKPKVEKIEVPSIQETLEANEAEPPATQPIEEVTNPEQKTAETQTKPETKAIPQVDPPDAMRPPPSLADKKILTSKGIGEKALRQLSQLKTRIDDDIAETETFEQFRRRSPSVLDGEPYPVPHSVKALSAIEEKEKNTTRYSDDLSIIKGDDGNCTIEQDLSNVGIEGVKAISGFRCGESKFDASFRDHMKKVLKKMGK